MLKVILLCDLINMKLVIEGFNKSIHKRSNRLVIKEKDEEIENIKIQDITDILIIGKGSISFDALNLIANNNVKLVSIDYYGNFNYILESPNQNNIELKRKQYLLSESFNGLEIARELIKSKISNQRYTLKTLNKNKKLESVKNSELKINDCINELDGLSLNENFLRKQECKSWELKERHQSNIGMEFAIFCLQNSILITDIEMLMIW